MSAVDVFNEPGRLYSIEDIQVFVESFMDKAVQAVCGVSFNARRPQNEIFLALRDRFFIGVDAVTIYPWWEIVIVTI